MKTVHVAAAVMIRGDRVYATQRGYGEFKDKWEFPGGKVEAGETPEKALVREIKEELAADISVGKRLTTVEYDYPEFHLVMDCYLCSVDPHALKLLEHENAEWLTWRDFNKMDWMKPIKRSWKPLRPSSRKRKEKSCNLNAKDANTWMVQAKVHEIKKRIPSNKAFV